MSISRQVHLDFHTSEHIPGIGLKFDPDAFADTIASAHVEAMVLFAKCHHGWSYYDTETGVRHPNLGFDLLRAQVDACKARGIQTKIYMSVGWDEKAAKENPGWRRILPDGQFHMMMGRNLDPYWSYLCLNTPYLEMLKGQLAELTELFPEADGYWLDIIREHECCCAYCRDGMEEAGLDWTDESDRKAYAKRVLDNYISQTNDVLRKHRADMPVFHNSSMAPRGDLSFYERHDAIEIEAVPTGGWGYDHFPISARYLDGHGYETMGVTTRFHIVWGELGGLKHPNALQAEAATMLAHGAAVCIGDHMDPSGRLDPDAWKMIGETFAETGKFSANVARTRPVADVGLLSSIALKAPGSLERKHRDCAEDEGAYRVLSQGCQLFNVLDADSDFSAYKAIVLPDRLRLSEPLARKLNDYVANGGGLLLTAESGLREDGAGFAVDIGAELLGKSPFEQTFVDPISDIKPDHAQGVFSVLAPSMRIRATQGESLGPLIEPYFERSPRAFSGHINTPACPEPSGYDAGVANGRVVYLAHALFSLYRQFGHVSIRDYILGALALARGARSTLEADAPSSATATLREDPATGDLLLQLVYAPRELRGESLLGPIEVIEDLPTLAQVTVSVAMETAPQSVMDVGAQEAMPFDYADGRLQLSIENLRGWRMIQIKRR